MLGYMKGKEPLGATIAHLHVVRTLLLLEYLGDWEQGLEALLELTLLPLRLSCDGNSCHHPGTSGSIKKLS